MHRNVHNILQRIERMMHGRVIFTTQRGNWGIGLASILLNDYIVAYLNCQYPLILRPSVPGASSLFYKKQCRMTESKVHRYVPKTFTIVGDCYIHATRAATS
jgi:hypothetical protein